MPPLFVLSAMSGKRRRVESIPTAMTAMTAVAMRCCSVCHTTLEKARYSAKQFKKPDAHRKCKACIAKLMSSRSAAHSTSNIAARLSLRGGTSPQETHSTLRGCGKSPPETILSQAEPADDVSSSEDEFDAHGEKVALQPDLEWNASVHVADPKMETPLVSYDILEDIADLRKDNKVIDTLAKLIIQQRRVLCARERQLQVLKQFAQSASADSDSASNNDHHDGVQATVKFSKDSLKCVHCCKAITVAGPVKTIWPPMDASHIIEQSTTTSNGRQAVQCAACSAVGYAIYCCEGHLIADRARHSGECSAMRKQGVKKYLKVGQ